MNRKIVIMTGPSGVGKATIEEKLFAINELRLQLSCSATTRNPRAGEVNGVHYYFLTHEEFDKYVNENGFVEWNAHFSNKYGTLKREIDRIWNEGSLPFLEIEVDGAVKVMQKMDPQNLITIYIAPPSREELEKRVRGRGTESEEQIKERMARLDYEDSLKGHFQHIIVNDNVDKAVAEIAKIIKKGVGND